MIPRESRWRKAFAKQSLSDLGVYGVLCNARGPLPHCHRLHYLQMHLEKLAKAFLWDQSKDETSIGDFHRTHNVVAKALPQIIREYWRQVGYDSQPDRRRMERIRDICRQIDLLAPAVDDGGRRPDNVEYPWPSPTGTGVAVPCEHRFPIDDRLRTSDGRMLLKIAAFVAQNLARK